MSHDIGSGRQKTSIAGFMICSSFWEGLVDLRVARFRCLELAGGGGSKACNEPLLEKSEGLVSLVSPWLPHLAYSPYRSACSWMYYRARGTATGSRLGYTYMSCISLSIRVYAIYIRLFLRSRRMLYTPMLTQHTYAIYARAYIAYVRYISWGLQNVCMLYMRSLQRRHRNKL